MGRRQMTASPVVPHRGRTHQRWKAQHNQLDEPFACQSVTRETLTHVVLDDAHTSLMQCASHDGYRSAADKQLLHLAGAQKAAVLPHAVWWGVPTPVSRNAERWKARRGQPGRSCLRVLRC